MKNVDAGYISHAGGDENLLIHFMWPKGTKTNEKNTYHEDLKTTATTATTKTKFSSKKNTHDNSKTSCM